jgi:hypothetical protein
MAGKVLTTDKQKWTQIQKKSVFPSPLEGEVWDEGELIKSKILSTMQYRILQET